MSPLILAAQATTQRPVRYMRRLGPTKLVLAGGLAVLLASGPDVRDVLFTSMADAYLQVSVFVAATLGVIYLVQANTRIDVGAALAKRPAWQPVIAALLGAMPGCGGAVAVVTQYAAGRLSFGSLIAVLTATMGDSAFLLLAAEPATGLALFAACALVGAVTGWVVDAIHGPGFMRPKSTALAAAMADRGRTAINPFQPLWLILLAPGLVLGVLNLAQVDTDALIPALTPYGPTAAIGLAGAALSLAMWILDPVQRFDPGVASGGTVATRMVNTTNFVTVWVVAAFLAYELTVHLSGIDLAAVFRVWGGFVPLLAVLVGFLPGCGPQIVVTSMYLNGALPMSAQLGNAISNDGDALFPTIAIAPRAAIIATLYSGVPALLVAYSYFWLFE